MTWQYRWNYRYHQEGAKEPGSKERSKPEISQKG
uniref:Uncharacterized protein n=1 Tax=Setaria italica TaxID=4555 RepID=K4AN74_SETIT